MAQLHRHHRQFDVFVSFRGGDTRDGFASHLYAALRRRNVAAFEDAVDLERGDEISPSILAAIARSEVCVVVISEGYAFSPWCLDEIAEIADCRRRKGTAVVPVFYRIDPGEVTGQLGRVGEALDGHLPVYEKETVERWRAALREVGNLSGWDSVVTRPESKLVDEVVNDVLNKLSQRCPRTIPMEGLVGIQSRIKEVESLLHKDLPNGDHVVLTVGIWGMGGIGKTTLAKAVFDQISPQFEDSFFLENVQEQLRKSKTIFHLLEELIRKILDSNTDDHSLATELKFVQDRLRRRKVLIVLDDVADAIQLQELLGNGDDRFGPGSRVIVTGRDRHVLSIVADEVYEVKPLDANEALELFCFNAFRKGHTLGDGDVEMSKGFLDYAKGNPLAIRILGLALVGRSREDWKSKMKRLGTIVNPDIQSVLRVSYDGLDREEQSVFLDIACFFRGEDRDYVTRVLDGCYSSVQIMISVLVDKALLMVSSSNTLEMHDLVQEMGRGIVLEQVEPGQRTRLWNPKDVFQALSKKKASGSVEGMFLDLSKAEEMHLEGDAFAKMDRLRLLNFHRPDYRSDVCNVHLPRCGLQSMSDELTLLHWHGFPSASLPFNFCASNLVELSLPFSKVSRLWQGVQHLGNLRSIDLEGSKSLNQIPDLSKAENLETVVLDGCERLVELPLYFQHHTKLKRLLLKSCKNLKFLPTRLDSKHLWHLDLSSCSKVTTCPELSVSLKELNLSGTAIRELPSSVLRLRVPKVLNLDGCSNIRDFPEISGGIKKLMMNRTGIKEVPSSSPMEHLLELEVLQMRNNEALTSFGADIGKLKSLQLLDLSGCSNLEYFSDISERPACCRNIRLGGCRGVSRPGGVYSYDFEPVLLDVQLKLEEEEEGMYSRSGCTGKKAVSKVSSCLVWMKRLRWSSWVARRYKNYSRLSHNFDGL